MLNTLAGLNAAVDGLRPHHSWIFYNFCYLFHKIHFKLPAKTFNNSLVDLNLPIVDLFRVPVTFCYISCYLICKMCVQLQIQLALEDVEKDLAITKISVFATIAASDDDRYINI